MIKIFDKRENSAKFLQLVDRRVKKIFLDQVYNGLDIITYSPLTKSDNSYNRILLADQDGFYYFDPEMIYTFHYSKGNFTFILYLNK